MGTATWGVLLLAVFGALLVIGTPGVLIGIALRLRGLWLMALVPLLGVSSIATAAVWSQAVGLRWSWIAPAVTSIALAATAFVLTARSASRRPVAPTSDVRRWAPPAAVGIGFILLAFRFITAIGRPDWFDQAGDNVFHLNLVRWILDHVDASPFDVMNLDGKTSSRFYPDAWHATVSLVCQLTGAPITVASNAVLFTTTCLIWVLGCVVLARTFFANSTPLLLGAGALSAGFATFPFLLIPYMGTYPLVFSIALLPAALAALAAALGVACGCKPRRLAVGLAVIIAAPGVALAHPSGLTMLAVMGLAPVFAALWRLALARPERTTLAILLSVLAASAVLAFIIFVRPNLAQPDARRATTAQALGEVLTGGFAGQDIPILLSALMVVGTVAALRQGGIIGFTAVGVFVLTSIVYIGAVNTDDFFRLVVSLPWYADATRVAAFTPIAILPLAARGAEWVWTWATGLVDFSAHPARLRIAQVAAVLVLGCMMVQSTAARGATSFMQTMFRPTDNQLVSPVPLSASDRALLARVPSLVPHNAVIAGDPWTGASFAYALTGRRTLVSHMLQPVTSEMRTFFDGISTSTATGPSCRAAHDLGVGWIIELHDGKTLPNRPRYKGLQNMASSPNLTLIDKVGDSSLYKITGCTSS